MARPFLVVSVGILLRLEKKTIDQARTYSPGGQPKHANESSTKGKQNILSRIQQVR